MAPIVPTTARSTTPAASSERVSQTSARKRAANRANATKSTGPRTAAGKAKVAQNARRHGLNRSAAYDPAFAGDVEKLARAICGLAGKPAAVERSDPALRLKLHLARRIAQAQVDIVRARRVRHDKLARAFADPNYRSPRGIRARIEMLSKVGELMQLGIPLPPEMARAFHFRHQGAAKYALILADLSGELLALDRYERRARSRRKFAIREFDKACSALARGPMRSSPPKLCGLALDPSVDAATAASWSDLLQGHCIGARPRAPRPPRPDRRKHAPARRSRRTRNATPHQEGTVAFWRIKGKEAKANAVAGGAKLRPPAYWRNKPTAALGETPGKTSYRDAARRVCELLRIDMPAFLEKGWRPP